MQLLPAGEEPVPPRVWSVPTRELRTQCLQPSTAFVRIACTKLRGIRMCRSCGTLIQPLLECVAPVHTAATVVRTNNAGRSFRFTTCCCLIMRDLDAVRLALSVQTVHVAVQPLLSCKGSVPPRVSSLPTRETLISSSQLFTV